MQIVSGSGRGGGGGGGGVNLVIFPVGPRGLPVMTLAIVTSRAVSPGKFKMAALGKTKISTSCDDHWKNWQQSD